MKGIKVHAFRVVPESKKAAPLGSVIDAIENTPLASRMRLCSKAEVRAEKISKYDGCYLLDFAVLRYENAPGRASAKTPVEDIDFKDGEAAAEETAALFDPANGHLYVQYNHYGVRSGRIAEYFSNFDNLPDNLYHLEPRFIPDVEARLAQKKIVKMVSFRVSTDAISQADKAHGHALGQVLSPAREMNAESIEITLNAAREKSKGLNRSSTRGILTWLQKRMGIEPESVTSIHVGGKVDEDAQMEVLNLLGQRLEIEFTDIKVGKGLRYPVKARWAALARARSGWAKTLK